MTEPAELPVNSTDCPYKAFAEAWRHACKIKDPERRTLYLIAICDRIAMANELYDEPPELPAEQPILYG